ncbi:MAG: trypsin-like peptidase domain-containing protein [Bdellovibrionales bacterium]|nr:trypsin-like peptidase domain-containing protein [Bdellovibrionales bacterium]
MKLHGRVFVGAFVGLAFSTSLLAQKRIRSVVYGEDDRKDGVEVLDAGWTDWHDRMKSVVSLWPSHQITIDSSKGTASFETETHRKREKLCKNEPFAGQKVGPFCSGSLIAKNLILTAGHCVASQKSCMAMSFVFDYRIDQWGSVGPESVPSQQVYGCKKLIAREEEEDGADYAIIELDRDVTDRLPVTLEKTLLPVEGDPVVSIGHPSGLPAKLADSAAIRSVEDSYFLANLDTFYNNSGSPVFDENTGNQVGILVRGEKDFKMTWKGCRVINECAEDECEGEAVTRIDYVLPLLKPFGI